MEALTVRAIADGLTDRISLFKLSSGRTLAINLMLSGRLQLCSPETRRLPYTQVTLRLSGGQELRYADRRSMGKLYVTDDLALIPGWTDMGPDALAPQLTLPISNLQLPPFLLLWYTVVVLCLEGIPSHTPFQIAQGGRRQ